MASPAQLVTFRSLIGDVDLLAVDSSQLQGSAATATVTELVQGSSGSLTGNNARLTVTEKVAGKPDFSGRYIVDASGNYSLHVSQLSAGGLLGQYFDTLNFGGVPTMERIDPTIDFDWSTGSITATAQDSVSVVWVGKLMVPKSELYTLYLTADDSAELFVNHSMLINASSASQVEHRTKIYLEGGVFYDFVLQYRDFSGTASVSLSYSSISVRKRIIPASSFFSAHGIVGSPFSVVVVPGTSNYPYTNAFGSGLSTATTGSKSSFFIQTQDSNGNNQSTNFELYSPADLLSVIIKGGPTVYSADVVYSGNGLFEASYFPLRAGHYVVSVKVGSHDIHCGQGQSNPCSPFDLEINPGPTVASMSEAESRSSASMDSLTEAVAGEPGYFDIQARDVYGNKQVRGGDSFDVMFTLSQSTSVSSSPLQYRGSVTDNGDGTYSVRYNVPVAGVYTVSVTLLTADGTREPILHCVRATAPYLFSRQYEGTSTYTPPTFCSQNAPQVTVAHNNLNCPTTTYDDLDTESLSKAVVGVKNSFHIQSRDAYGNLRRGDQTTHFSGYGDGTSDYFQVDFTHTTSGDSVRVSSAIDEIIASPVSPTLAESLAFFRLSFGGRTTFDIPSSISAHGLEGILEALFDFDLDVIVMKSQNVILGSNNVQVKWQVQFLSMFDSWRSLDGRLALLPPSTNDLTYFNLMSLARPAQAGVYPVSYTLWQTGSYLVRITSGGVDIQGSPAVIAVSNAPVDATASTSFGPATGLAGSPMTVNIQAKDARQTEVQYIISSAEVGGYVNEVQQVSFTAPGTYTVTFRGQSVLITTGTTSYGALAALSTFGDVAFASLNGSLIAHSTVIGGTDTFTITFSSLVGPLPLIVSSSSPNEVIVTRSSEGYALFRPEVKVVETCSLTQSNGLSFVSGAAAVSVASMSAADVRKSISSLGYGDVSISSPDCPVTVSLCSCTLFVQFDNFKGPVPPLSTNNPSVRVSESPTDGALVGLFPLYGTFSVGIHGENSTQLPFDASALDVQNALVRFNSVGNIIVTKDTYGIAYSNAGKAMYGPSGHIFSIWTVFFTSTCNGNVNGIASGNCPSSLGQEPLISIDTSQIQFPYNPYSNQQKPSILAVEAVPGYPGNNRPGNDDLNLVSISLQRRGLNQSGRIGMNDIQRLDCTLENESKKGTFVLKFLNQSVSISSDISVRGLTALLSSTLDSTFLIEVTAIDALASSPICSSTGSSSQLLVTKPSGTAFPVIQVDQIVGVVVDIISVAHSVDSIVPVVGNPGMYEIAYTPTKAGVYDIRVMIDGVDVSTDWTAGVSVQPALEYGPASTHNATQVAVEGAREYFAIQLRDRFGNYLEGPIQNTSRLIASMVGERDPRAASSSDSISSVAVPVNLLTDGPISDGQYSMYYDPTVAGSYELSVKLVTRGGLLGTYFRSQNFSNPVLASRGNFYDLDSVGGYRDPYWCDGLSNGEMSTGNKCFDVNCTFYISIFAMNDCGCLSFVIQSISNMKKWGNTNIIKYNSLQFLLVHDVSLGWEMDSFVYCDSTIATCGCDSTRLDSSLSFSWDNGSPLPYESSFPTKFPVDYFSARWTGYISSPQSGLYTFFVEADGPVSVSVNGTQYLYSAVPGGEEGGGGKIVSVWLVMGDLNAILVTYSHEVGSSYLRITWSGPGVIKRSALSSDDLYYERVIANSPLTVVVYPGLVNPQTSDASGAGLQTCTAMGDCSFTIQSRDAHGNNVFNKGDFEKQWNVTIVGSSDWAGEGRVNDVISYSGPTRIVPTIHALGWQPAGFGSIARGSKSLTISANAIPTIHRGATILVGVEAILVDSFVQAPLYFDSHLSTTFVPLSRPYLGDADLVNAAVYVISNSTTGQYVVGYSPLVKGTYAVYVETIAVEETQQVEITVDDVLDGYFSLTVHASVDGSMISYRTSPLTVKGLVVEDISRALMALDNIGRVTVSILNATISQLKFQITFHNMNANVPEITVNAGSLIGAHLAVNVKEIVQGMASTAVGGSPFKLIVLPNSTDAQYSVAYGMGLSNVSAGQLARFTIQSKDAFGNDRLASQSRDIYRVHAFNPQMPLGSSTYEATVVTDHSPGSEGAYSGTLQSIIQYLLCSIYELF